MINLPFQEEKNSDGVVRNSNFIGLPDYPGHGHPCFGYRMKKQNDHKQQT